MYYWEWFKEHEIYRMYLEGLGGAAKFGSIKSFRKHRSQLRFPLFFTDSAGVMGAGFFLGRTLLRYDPMPRLQSIDDESHLCVFAPNGAGKSVSFIDHLTTYKGDIIYLDPKGEHTKKTFYRRCSPSFLADKGISAPEGVNKFLPNGEAYVYDPMGITGVKSCFYNPIISIDIHADDCRRRIMAITNAVVLPEKQKHFQENPANFIAGMIAYVLEKFPNEPAKQSLPSILDILTGVDEDGNADLSQEYWNELILDLATCKAADGLAREAASTYKKWSDKERGSHFGVIMRSLKCFGDSAIRRSMMGNDIDFSKVGTKVNSQGETVVQTIYMAIPDDRMKEFDRLLRMFIADATVTMRSREKHPEHRTLFVLDEAALLGNMQALEKGIGVVRGHHQKYLFFFQGLGQLKAHYPETWNAMIAQSSSIFFGQPPTDLETLEFISKALGSHNIGLADLRGLGMKKGDTDVRPFLTTTEISIIIGKGKNKMIVFPSEGYPLLLERLCFKPLSIGGKRFSGLPLDGLRGHFPKYKKT
jgi:type IV secretory pathway TraG/TraD family ATPase VirD4